MQLERSVIGMKSCRPSEAGRRERMDEAIPALASSIALWFRENQRSLPWRLHLDDPYSVWIAEVMLQQTQAATVAPYYLRWMERWPTVNALAKAPVDEVLAAWSGLGYYARARNLHRAATIIAERHNGSLPSDPRELAELPGIGDYTKGAILSIAFNQPFPAIDGNAMRVLSRLLASDGTGRGARQHMEATVLAMMAAASPREISQALMELGALVCLPAAPLCGCCPAAGFCLAAAAGRPDRWPERRPRPPSEAVTHAAIVLHNAGRYLMARRHSGGRWGGLWEFPRRECLPGEAPAACAERAAGEVAGMEAEAGGCIASLKHRFTRYTVTLHAYLARDWSGTPRPADCAELAWFEPGEMVSLPLSSPQRAVARALLKTAGTHGAGVWQKAVE